MTNNAEKLIAVVERQAMLEALLQAIVNNLDLDDKSKLSNVSVNSDLYCDQPFCCSCQQFLIK